MDGREILKNRHEVNVSASNGNNRTFLHISHKSRDLPKAPENARKVVNIPLDRRQKIHSIISIKGGADARSSAPCASKIIIDSCHVQQLLKWIDCQQEEKG